MRQLMIACVALVLLLGGARRSQAGLIANGNFATGDFTDWTQFTTPNGTFGSYGYPLVRYDSLATGQPAYSAVFNVGQVTNQGTQNDEEGGGLRQNVSLPSAGLYNFSADVAVNAQWGSNVEGGLFELLFDGTVVASQQFGNVFPGNDYRATLSGAVTASAGQHQVEILVERSWGPAPEQYVTNVSLNPASAATPEPASLTLLSLGACSLLGYGWRRKKAVTA